MNIVVNSTAARVGGAISILNQFIYNIPDQTDNLYHIFVNKDFNQIERKNVRYYIVDTTTWMKRISWDSYGLRKYLISLSIFPDIIISLQNTGVLINDKIPQIIYYHQLLPLTEYKWNFFRKEESLCYIYSNIYPFFTKLFINKQTQIVVQADFIKKAFSKKFNFPENKIHVVQPEIELNIDNHHFFKQHNNINLIYPANKFIYKNHKVLINALDIIKNNHKGIYSKIKLFLTIKEDEVPNLYKYIIEKGLCDKIVFLGKIPHHKLIEMFYNMKALVFPSFIETIGLPLLEAAGIGLSILASDLPYAKNAVKNYNGVEFLPYNDANKWAQAIVRLSRNNIIENKPYIFNNYNNGWNKLFELIDTLK